MRKRVGHLNIILVSYDINVMTTHALIVTPISSIGSKKRGDPEHDFCGQLLINRYQNKYFYEGWTLQFDAKMNWLHDPIS